MWTTEARKVSNFAWNLISVEDEKSFEVKMELKKRTWLFRWEKSERIPCSIEKIAFELVWRFSIRMRELVRVAPYRCACMYVFMLICVQTFVVHGGIPIFCACSIHFICVHTRELSSGVYFFSLGSFLCFCCCIRLNGCLWVFLCLLMIWFGTRHAFALFRLFSLSLFLWLNTLWIEE